MKTALLLLALTGVLGLQAVAQATHGNNAGAHWAQSTVRFYDSVDATWDAALSDAVATWDGGLTHLNTARLDAAQATTSRCTYARKAVHVCSFAYGNSGAWNGVAGMAQYRYSLPGKHITRARIRLNDTNTPGGVEEAVTVHEIGHTLGLDHRPKTALTSCMTATVTGVQTSPDAHDFAVVDRLHRHKGAKPAKGSYDGGATTTDLHKREVRRGDHVDVTWILPA